MAKNFPMPRILRIPNNFFFFIGKKKIPKLQHNRINTQLSRKNDEKNCNELHSIVLMLGVFFFEHILYTQVKLLFEWNRYCESCVYVCIIYIANIVCIHLSE